MKRICTIYRSPKREGMYLYVDKAEDLERVPGPLLQTFGKPEHAMVLVLSPERQLARVDVSKVLSEVEEKGFFLQMPPRHDGYNRDLHEKNSKIPLR
ncbi:MAG: YcgL domain-containing protein [Oceanicoccus sp.]